MTRDELRIEWVRRLRSGEYKQCNGALRKGDGFCCMGVAAEILVEQGRISRTKFITTGGIPHSAYDGVTTVLPQTGIKAFGLRSANGCHRWVGENLSLTQLNDHGRDFSTIADAIDTGDFWDLKEADDDA